MKRYTQFFFVLMTVSILVSCEREEIKNGIVFYWNQTKCLDPWKTGQNDSNKKSEEALKTYLKVEGVSAVDVLDFENTLKDGVNTCDSCGCLTGIRIILEVEESDEAKMIALGFIKK